MRRHNLNLLLAIGAFALLSIGRPTLAHKDVETGASPELTEQYNDFNFDYFNGTLPSLTVEVTNEQPKWMGNTLPCGPRCFRIIISNPWTPAPVEKSETLFHEMCHVKVEMDGAETFDVHGPAWQKYMLKLASQGAFTPMNAQGVVEPIW